MTISICSGPSYTLATSPDDRPTRFCFRCRKHLPHTWALMDDPPERQPSYYEAVSVLHCSRCGEDHADFPGTYIDGPRYPSEGVWAYLVEHAQRVRASWDWDAIWERARLEEEATIGRNDGQEQP